MRGKSLLITGAALATGAVSGVTSYRTWQRREIARLRSESHIIETDLGPIEYRMSGSGPAVLILHGSPGGYDMGVAFSKFINDQSFTYIAVSRPGYLRTPLESGRSPQEQADLYAALLDKLHIQEAAVIGISGGGPSALQFALRHPQRCRKLITISGVAQRYSELEIKQAFPPLKRFFRQIYERVVSFEPLLYLALPLVRLQPTLPGSEDLLRSVAMIKLRKQGYDNDMEQFAAISMYPLETIQAPTLIVHGTADDEVLFADSELLVSKVPHSTLLAVTGASHMAFYTHAGIVMPALRKFLRVA